MALARWMEADKQIAAPWLDGPQHAPGPTNEVHSSANRSVASKLVVNEEGTMLP